MRVAEKYKTVEDFKKALINELGLFQPENDRFTYTTFDNPQVPEDRQGKVTVDFIEEYVWVSVTNKHPNEAKPDVLLNSPVVRKNWRGGMTFRMKINGLMNVWKFHNIEYLINSIKA